MLVTKPLDLGLLRAELLEAGITVGGLTTSGGLPSEQGAKDLQAVGSSGLSEELPPEAGPVVDAHDASKPKRTAAFEEAEDAERLRLVSERSRTDPAFAALAELALKGQNR